MLKALPSVGAERQRIALTAEIIKPKPPAEPVAEPVAEALLPAAVEVKALEGAKPKPAPVAAPAKRTGNAAVKRASARAEKVGKFAMYARELKAGRNPGKKNWEIVFFDLLLRGEMTRQELIRNYVENAATAYTLGTARTRACTTLAMFETALFIRVDGDMVRLHPHVERETTATNYSLKVIP